MDARPRGLTDEFHIDLANQAIFPLSEYPEHAPRRGGRKQHISTGYRHAGSGVRADDGTIVRLPTIRFGGARYTSLEAMQWFADRLGRRAGDRPEVASPARRRDSVERAARELDAFGL